LLFRATTPGAVWNSGTASPSRLLAPHLRQAIRAQSRLRDLNGARDVTLEALEYLTHGVVLADHDGKVLFANTAAVGLFCQSDDLSIRTGGCLQVALRSEETSLGLLIHQAGGSGQEVRSGGAVHHSPRSVGVDTCSTACRG
jgi:hypothetical protein